MDTDAGLVSQTLPHEWLVTFKIAVAASKETLRWLIILHVLLIGAAALSVGITLLSTTTAGVFISLIFVLGLTALQSKRVRNDFQPPQ